jgi:RNA polymerase sigma-54 factor
MAYELKQELRLTQNLVMTPQLQLAIRLLQLSRLELVELVREETQTNPVLDEAGEEDVPAPERTAAETPEVDWQAYMEERSDFRPGIDFNDREEEDQLTNVTSSTGALGDHLLWQMRMSGLTPEDQAIGEFIIGNIGEDGYLRLVDRAALSDAETEEATLAEISRLTGAPAPRVAEVLGVVQRFDPAGVGARHLKECLMTQARALPIRDTVVEEIIDGHLEKLARKGYKAIARAIGITVEEVYEAARVMSRGLNPTPGAGFGASESRAIVPDIFIHKVGGEYVISLNEDGLPKLRISPYYRRLLGNGGQAADDARGYIRGKIKSAVWLIRSVHQRQRTIYRVVECIVRFQREFLDKGLKYLKPLVLKDVAAELGVHESTVSRVTSNKYVQTPMGIFELKYFFSTSMSSSDGGDLTVEYIREQLRGIIRGEDAMNPLSDKQIVDLLGKSGIVLARRTVTKYRESLGYLSSTRRKAHY